MGPLQTPGLVCYHFRMNECVLIIEDEVDVRDAMADAITQAGYEVITANDGDEGIKLAFERHPNLILLDLVMPVMDGHEFLSRLREDPWGKEAKVLVITSMDDINNVVSAHEGKIEDYIIKAHTSLDELVKHVRTAMFKNR